MEKWESKASVILKYRRMANQSDVVERERKLEGEIDCKDFHRTWDLYREWDLYRWVLEMAWKKDGLKPSDIFPETHDPEDDEWVIELWSKPDCFLFAFDDDVWH